MTDLASRLRAARSEAGMSQRALADAVGMVQQEVSRYEQGAREPSWSRVVEIAEALDVSLDWLAGRG